MYFPLVKGIIKKMKVSFILEVSDKKALEYRQDYKEIAKRVSKKLKLANSLCCAVIFVSDEAIRLINKEYRDIDRATDVISFALKDEVDDYLVTQEISDELGDIFISVDAIKRQAKEYKHSYQREALFLFTHGLLHLLGYDHQNKADEEIMFTLQEELLYGLVKEV